MYASTYVTLNISSTSVRLLSVGGGEVKNWGSAPLPPGLVKDGLILRPRVVGAVISALFKSTGIPKTRVIVSLTGLSFIHRILSLPRTKAGSLPEVIERAARKEMPLPPEELYLCQQSIGRGADEESFFVLGVPRNPVDVLVEMLKEAGIPPYLVDLNPLALARVANREEAIIVNLEPDCFDIVLVADGLPAIMHTIMPRGTGATMEDNTRQLSDELLKTVDFYNNNHPQKPLGQATPILMTGELSVNAAISEFISTSVGHPAEPLVPPLKLPHDFPAASFATNIGLALKKLPKPVNRGKAAPFRDINLNILSGKFGPAINWFSPSLIMLSIALLTGLGALLPVNNLRSQAETEMARLQTQLTGINQDLNQAVLSASKAKEMEDAINKITTDMEAAKRDYQSILSKGGDFAGNLILVTDALPPEAYFTATNIDKSQITVKGGADSPATVVRYVFALEALDKFSEVRIISIDDSKDVKEAVSAAVSFNIIISK